MSFPRARVFADVSMVSAGEDVVVFVLETMRYHTFGNGAFDLWQAADGTRSEDDLALSVYGDRSEFSRRRVQVGLEQLAEADLLEDAPGSVVSRRRLAKLGAAAAVAGLPVVTSITAPDSVSAATVCGELSDGTPDCTTSGECEHCCCCQMQSTVFCASSGALCREYGYTCI